MPPGPSLRNALDRDVLQIVRKYQDEKPEEKLKVHLLYQYIQRSNSSLRRRQKAHLEDSIDRVIAVIQFDEEEDDDEELEAAPVPSNSAGVSNFMSLLVRDSLNKDSSRSGTEVMSKKRDGSSLPNGESRKKKKRQEAPAPVPAAYENYKLADIGGMDPVLRQLGELLVLPLLYTKKYSEAHIKIPRGILLHGPPGCGKTLISRAFAAELGVPTIEILGPSVVSGMSGESEQKIREHFEEAKRLAPSILFIDEIDVLAPKRESSQSQMEKRIVAQLLISMDSLRMESVDDKPVIVLAATNRPDSIDPALRRGGRFDTEININVPNERMRESILQKQTQKLNLASDIDFRRLAKLTAGFVGSDLEDFVSKAASWTMEQFRQALEAEALKDAEDNEMDLDREVDNKETSRIRLLIQRARQKDERPDPPGFEHIQLRMEAFMSVFPVIQPSSKREGFATVPDTTWDDVGALEEARKKLEQHIVTPIQHPDLYEKMGIRNPAGVLLWGPPGCGKTLLAKAVANESKANFISIKGPELLNKYVGESERAVRQVFTRARSSVPCVLFFDELDALVPRRDDTGSEASSRVVNTLLTELDGMSAREGIFVVAATNRPDMIDPAMLRPGRMDTLIYVGLPGPEDRVAILKTLMSKLPMDQALADLGRLATDFSGADLASVTRSAALAAIERKSEVILEQDMRAALSVVRPSVGDIKKYERMKEKLVRG